MIGSTAIGSGALGSSGSGGAPYARLSATGPLGAPAVLAGSFCTSYVQAHGPLGLPAVLGASICTARLSAGLLGVPGAVGWHDFTGQLGDLQTLFVMDLQTPAGPVRVPVSSWQATLRAGGSNYVQCVVPACLVWVSSIQAATEFVIYRQAELPGGVVIDYEMARSPLEQVAFDRGPARYTCTLSGYAPGFAAADNPPAVYDRDLSGVRSVSSGTASMRVRCAVDWLLRPGHRAFVDGEPFVVDYINYYSPAGFDSYMDVGSAG